MSISQTIERTALTQLITNEQYARKVLPFIKSDYFADKTERIVFEEITKFVDKYNKIPTQTSLEIEVSGRKDLNEEEFKKVVAVIQTLESTDVDFEWLVNTTEQFCKDKAVYNAIVEGISIIDGRINNEVQMLYLVFSQTPLLLVLIIVLAMITLSIPMTDSTSTIQ